MTGLMATIGTRGRASYRGLRAKASQRLILTPEKPPLKDVLLFLGIYAYFTGFVYIYFLYNQLGISLNSLDIPAYYFFVYSYNLVSEFAFSIGLVMYSALCLIGLILIPGRLMRALALTVFLIVPFPLLSFLARRKAVSVATEMRMGKYVNEVHFVFKDQAKQFYPQEITSDDNPCDLILETKDRFYVLCQPLGEEGVAELPVGHVHQISKADIYSAQVDVPNIRIPKENQ